MTIPFINIFLLAEAGYAQELGFVRNKMVILENKLRKIQLPDSKKWSHDDQNIHLLFSGTLAPTTGIFVAIDLATRLHAVDPKIRLHIVGFSPMISAHQKIKDLILDKPFIVFTDRSEPVPHIEIVEAIQHADFGIIAYPPNPSTQNTIPTKLFEYLGYTLPILLIDHKPWVERCQIYPAAIPFNAEVFSVREILNAMRNTTFYTKIPADVFWKSEEVKLMQIVSNLIQ